MIIRQLSDLGHPDFPLLLESSQAEGFRFLQRLQDDWDRGTNCFDKPGEIYLGAFQNEHLIGVGGLNAITPSLGRVRRFYVLPEHRRTGVGRALVDAIVQHAKPHFSELEVHTIEAAHFYEPLGFTPTGLDDPTHRMNLQQ